MKLHWMDLMAGLEIWSFMEIAYHNLEDNWGRLTNVWKCRTQRIRQMVNIGK